MHVPSLSNRYIAIAFVALLVLAAGPTAAVAQSAGGSVGATQAAGTVVVDDGETISSLDVMAGTVIVRGTVAGDLNGVAGDVVVAETGVVEGDVSVATGSLRIAGTVDGSVERRPLIVGPNPDPDGRETGIAGGIAVSTAGGDTGAVTLFDAAGTPLWERTPAVTPVSWTAASTRRCRTPSGCPIRSITMLNDMRWCVRAVRTVTTRVATECEGRSTAVTPLLRFRVITFRFVNSI